MVPPLSALSFALCHDALEGGGNHKMVTIISQKETSPLAHFVHNAPLVTTNGCIQMVCKQTI